MKRPDFSRIAKSVKVGLHKHSPEILTGIGIAGMITTTVLAVRATPKALILIEEEKRRQNKELYEDAERKRLDSHPRVDRLKPIELVRTTWVCYIPATITGALSIACLIGASSVNIRRNAALAAAYSLSESALKEYQEKVIETIGEKKEQEIRDAVAKDKIQRDPVVNKEVIITGRGETLCYDTITSRYFKCDIEKLRRVENELNKRLISEMYISLNEFYYEIGLRSTDIGDDLGWNLADGFINLEFSSQLAEDETPCLVIGYRVAPRYDFRTLM